MKTKQVDLSPSQRSLVNIGSQYNDDLDSSRESDFVTELSEEIEELLGIYRKQILEQAVLICVRQSPKIFSAISANAF